MATDRMTLAELVRKAGDDGDLDFLREGVRLLAEALMDVEVSAQIGADKYERSAERSTYRNGHRRRRWDTRVGSVRLRIPKLREGSYYPSLLEPRRRAERALAAVIQEAYVHGVSTRKVDDLVQALGMTGISKSEVSRVCGELDGMVEAFRTRPLEGSYPYLWLDATYVKAREDGRVVSTATVVAIGVKSTGEREVLGVDVGSSEDGAFWLAFLRSLVARGLKGVRLVVSDAHEGLKGAIEAVLTGASWQRCRVHFLRNLLGLVPKSAQAMVAATVRTIWAQPDAAAAQAQLGRVAESLEPRFPKVAEKLLEAEDEVLASFHFPAEHRRQISSTNPLERVIKEIKRRTDVVGIFPNREAVIRLITCVLIEQHEEWAIARRYFSAESMAKLDKEVIQNSSETPLLEESAA